MTQHPKSKERKSNWLGKEYPPDFGRYVGERITHTADDEVLERCGFLHKWCPVLTANEVALTNKSIR